MKFEVFCLKVYNLLIFLLQFYIYYIVLYCVFIKNFLKYFKIYIDVVYIYDVDYFDKVIYIRMFCYLLFFEIEFSRKIVF